MSRLTLQQFPPAALKFDTVDRGVPLSLFSSLPITILDLCAYLGLGAVGAATVNLLLGMLMSLRYSPLRMWPHRRVNLFALHQWTAYLAVALPLTPPAVLLLLREPRFRLLDILWPLHSPLQPKLNLAGAAAQAFNVLNHLNFARPTGSLSSGSFGQITTTINPSGIFSGVGGDDSPRILQLKAKVVF